MDYELNKLKKKTDIVIDSLSACNFNTDNFNNINNAYATLEQNILNLLTNNGTSLREFFNDLTKLRDLDKKIYMNIISHLSDENIKELNSSYYNIIEGFLFVGNYSISLAEDNIIRRKYGTNIKDDKDIVQHFDVSDNLLRVFTNLYYLLNYTIEECRTTNNIYFKYFSNLQRNIFKILNDTMNQIYKENIYFEIDNDNEKRYRSSINEIYGFIRNGKLYKVNNLTENKPYKYTFVLRSVIDEEHFISINEEDAFNMNLLSVLKRIKNAKQAMNIINIPIFKSITTNTICYS